MLLSQIWTYIYFLFQMFIIVIDLCIPENWNCFPWVYVNKLRNDRIFKTLRFEKSHESIDLI